MKFTVVAGLAFSACLLVCVKGASFSGDENVGDSRFGSAPHIIGGDRLGRYDHHTFVIRLKLSNSTRQTKGFKYCSGVRLSDEWLMTAASCLQIPSYKYIRITSPDGYAFRHNYYEIEEPSKRTRPELKYIIHPNYNATTKAYNVALIKSDFVSVPHRAFNPILPYLSDGGENLTAKAAVVSSYESYPGIYVEDDKEYVHNLAFVIDETEVCKNDYNETGLPNPVPSAMFLCANSAPAKGLTPDDIGAPLLYQENRFSPKKLIGIACALRDFSGSINIYLFTKIFPLLEWISQHTDVPLIAAP